MHEWEANVRVTPKIVMRSGRQQLGHPGWVLLGVLLGVLLSSSVHLRESSATGSESTASSQKSAVLW